MPTSRSSLALLLLGAFALPRNAPAAALAAFPRQSERPSLSPILPVSDPREAKFRGELSAVLRDAKPTDLVPISIVMAEQLPRDEVARLTDGLPRKDRRLPLMNALKALSAASQKALLDELRAAQSTGAAQQIESLWIHNVVGARVTPDLAYRIADRADVAYLNWNQPIGRELFPVEPPSPESPLGPGPVIECGVQLMGTPLVWNNLGITGAGVVVAVIDTGCCITHPDLVNQIWTNPGEIPGNGIDDDNNGYVDDIHGWSFEFNGSSPDISDSWGHGTHVTGTVAGDGTNGNATGMAPDCKIMTTKFWNSFSGELSVWLCQQYALANGADITTASLGWPHWANPDRVTWRTVVENSIAGGQVVLYAAGNEGCNFPPDNVRTPGDVPSVLTIGATDCLDNLASFSSCGPITWQGIFPYNDCPYPPGCIKPTVAAPGVNTLSTDAWSCSGYTTLSGTSMATPHVAGAAALILQANPNLSHAQVVSILKATAVDLGVPGEDNQFGAGRVNAYAAVSAAMPSGACCTPDGSCQVTTAAKCEEIGGTYLGNNTSCFGDADGNGVDDACESIQVKGFSKNACSGGLSEGAWKVTKCQTTPQQWTSLVGADAVLEVKISSNDDTCAPFSTCDEAKGVNGKLAAKVGLNVRLNGPCPVRGSWEGEFSIVDNSGNLVATGTIDGVLGVGSHRAPNCVTPVNQPCGTRCERCYASVPPSTDPGLWRIHTEGSLKGVVTAGPNAGCSIKASVQGYFHAPAGGDGLPLPTNEAPWYFCGTADGVLICDCPVN